MSVMSSAPCAVELLARISGDRDRHVEQQLVAAPGGDDDFLVARRPRRRSASAGCSRSAGSVSGFSCATAGVVTSAAAATVPSKAARAKVTRISMFSPFARDTLPPAIRICSTES